jgi:hypothetical protein
MSDIIGAFIFPEVWNVWDQVEARSILGRLRDFGVNAIFTESESYRDDLIRLSHQMGLLWFGGIACFSDHAHSNQLLSKRPELWPIDEDGNRRPPMEWHIGVTPTFEDYKTSRLELIEQLVRTHEFDGFMLDFIRWPVHWELELRPGASRPLQTSFDPHTLACFQTQTGINLPNHVLDPASRARWILTHHASEWTEFKCSVITQFVRAATTRIRSERNREFVLGLYALPLPPNEMESIAGQRLQDLASFVDVIAPMTYHAILHRHTPWVTEIIESTERFIPGKLLPVLQVDSAEGIEAGADWGPAVPPSEWEEVVRHALRSSSIRGLIAFTGTALFRDQRGELLETILAART